MQSGPVKEYTGKILSVAEEISVIGGVCKVVWGLQVGPQAMVGGFMLGYFMVGVLKTQMAVPPSTGTSPKLHKMKVV